MPVVGRLAAKVTLVTGAGSGIGRATALLLARAGAAVAVADRNGQTAAETTAQIVAAGDQAVAIEGDVSTDDGAARIVQATMDACGRLDVLVNNAGISQIVPLAEVTEAHIEQLLAVNLKGPLYMAKHAIAAMIAGGRGGALVNVASASGLRARPDTPVYCATKGAIVALTRSLALDFARHGIRANCVCPSATETPMLHAHYASLPDGAEQYRRNVAAVPLQRLAQPVDIAHAILFLASDEAAYITGDVLVVDGGSMAGTMVRWG